MASRCAGFLAVVLGILVLPSLVWGVVVDLQVTGKGPEPVTLILEQDGATQEVTTDAGGNATVELKPDRPVRIVPKGDYVRTPVIVPVPSERTTIKVRVQPITAGISTTAVVVGAVAVAGAGIGAGIAASGGGGGGPKCGNGKKEGNEQCDGADLGGATCSQGGQISCNSNCTLNETACSKCGNGKKEGNEQCDGADLGGATCSQGGQISCNSNCTLNETACSKCGNGKKEGTEECDGSDLGGQQCPTGGQLACTNTCKLDTSGCFQCGNGKKEGTEQCDGTDLGGATCQSLGFGSGGTPKCFASGTSQQCQYDISGCSSCGNNTWSVSIDNCFFTIVSEEKVNTTVHFTIKNNCSIALRAISGSIEVSGVGSCSSGLTSALNPPTISPNDSQGYTTTLQGCDPIGSGSLSLTIQTDRGEHSANSSSNLCF